MQNIDLTTLPGWEGLSEGSHNITIVAKADGYLDSEHSSAVVVTKATTPTEDELAGTWVFKEMPSINTSNYNVQFISNNLNFSSIELYLQQIAERMFYGGTKVYDSDEGLWVDNAYKTITITSKLSEVTNGQALLTWLKANATKQ